MMGKKYITNKDLYCEIIVSKEMGKLTREAERMLILLGKNIIRKFRYKDEDDRLDCLQNGYTQIFSNWYQFDENKSDNAFSYYTEIFKRGIAAGWNNIHKTKGDNVILISLDGFNDEGERYNRF